MINFANERNEEEDCYALLASITKQDIQTLERLILDNDSLYEMHDQVGTLMLVYK